MTYAQAGFLAFMWFGIYTESLGYLGIAMGFVAVQFLEIWSNHRKERAMFELMDKINDHVCSSEEKSKKGK